MANNLKGLVIEIGGDTTKLADALRDVDRKANDLSGELKELNKMLKFDPGNTDLITQKQKVLAEMVENTTEKLGKLKQAEKQVQEQFKRGEVSEAQVRALQREIIATEKKLDRYKQGVDDSSKSTRKFSDESKKAEGSIKQLGAGAVAAGTFFGGLFKDMLKGAADKLRDIIQDSRDYRTEMGKLDTAFTQNGHTSEAATGAYKELQGILGETDQSVEAANHLAKLTDNEKDLSTWTGDILPGVFATFGDSLPIEGLTEAANETAKVGQVTGPLADALNWAGVSEDKFNESLAKCSSEQERQALITETLVGLYGEASAAYKENNAEVIRANQANEAWMESLAGVGGAMEPIITDVKMMGASMLSDLVPGVEKLAESFRGLLSGDMGAASGIGEALSGIITQLLGKVTELAPTLVQAAIGLVTSLTTSLVSMLPQLVTVGVQLISTILDGLTSAIPQITQAIVDMLPLLTTALVNGIPQLIQGAVQLFLALVEAIPRIIPQLVAALPSIVMALVNGLLTAIPQLIQGAVQFFTAIIQAIPMLIEMLVPQIPTIVQAIVTGLAQNIPVLIQGAVQLLNAIVQAIPLIIQALVPQIPTIVTTIVNCLLQNFPVLLDGAVQLLMALVQAIPQIVAALIQNLPSILRAILSVLSALPSLLWGILTQVLSRVGAWVSQMAGKAMEAGSRFLSSVVQFLSQLPGRAREFLSNVISNVASWAGNMAAKASEAGQRFLNSVVNFFTQLPGKIWSFLSNVLSKVAGWATSLVAKGREAASKLVSSVVDGIKGLPAKVLSVGKDLVTGLWNGINDKLSWLKKKISGFTSSVLDGIKGFFGVESPSKETAWIGEMLDEGLAKGVASAAKSPIRAMQSVSSRVLDAAAMDAGGITFERSLQAPRMTGASVGFAAGVNDSNTALLAKLDGIYERLSRLQIVLDTGTLVGETVDKFDTSLARRQALSARGV